MSKQFLQEKEQEFIEHGYVIFPNLYTQEEVIKMHDLSSSVINMTKNINYPHDGNIHKIAPLLNQGDVLCMNQYLVHFSLPNESELSRIVLINGFSVVGANHKPYPGEGSAQLIELPKDNYYLDDF